MNLPDAAPGYSGGVMAVNSKRCWANRPYQTTGMGQCSSLVDPDDDLGLCAEHVEEFRCLAS